ncbi:MAG: hypothetical protein DI551_01575 [Micavibrio aeruginosavorus]|uniref:Colicin D immunity protein domain-containing protein n=1 Tax=Micavibrio aeruginosavorus TaxID=349221 RepID=A0A2W5N7D9_9BACT|nr:MAG: hypothetical protein DI551_01575 [Micavibrio aeruginosavorus]
MKNLFGYDLLIEKFLRKEISAPEFEDAYLDKYLGDKDPIDENLFLILDWLFAEVDGFSNNKEVFPDDYVDENQLRESAAKTLEELRALK